MPGKTKLSRPVGGRHGVMGGFTVDFQRLALRTEGRLRTSAGWGSPEPLPPQSASVFPGSGVPGAPARAAHETGPARGRSARRSGADRVKYEGRPQPLRTGVSNSICSSALCPARRMKSWQQKTQEHRIRQWSHSKSRSLPWAHQTNWCRVPHSCSRHG